MREKCYCGCGQAPGTSCRQRLLRCDGCGIKVRMSREALAAVVLSCSCSGTLRPQCLEDMARAGDESAWTELSGRMLRQSVSSAAGKRSAQARRNRAAARELSPDELAAFVGGDVNLTAAAGLALREQRRDAERVVTDDLPF